jgi:hypothetical protein
MIYTTSSTQPLLQVWRQQAVLVLQLLQCLRVRLCLLQQLLSQLLQSLGDLSAGAV